MIDFKSVPALMSERELALLHEIAKSTEGDVIERLIHLGRSNE